MLDSDHSINWDNGETEETDPNFEKDIISENIICEDCNHNDDPSTIREIENNKTIETIETEVENEEFRIECDGCGREIEFGWSHPDRGGRIWPAEGEDHNPGKS